MNNPQQLFATDIYLHPGENLAEKAASMGVGPKTIMRDYIAYDAREDLLTITVGDMANNLTGSTYQDESRAVETGLPRDYEFNGGLIGSMVLRAALRGYENTGSTLVRYANATLASTYQEYGMGESATLPADERFTGYLTHAKVGSVDTVLTAVGDVNAWINGQRVVGAEKAVDTEKDLLITELANNLEQDAGLIDTHMRNIIHAFATKARLGEETAITLYRQLRSALDHTETPDRQTMYRPVDDIVTPWQIRTLQNRLPETHPWAYGAIDGAETPEPYIESYNASTEDIETLVIATDGSAPSRLDTAVRTADDLMVVNRRFSEQAIVALRR